MTAQTPPQAASEEVQGRPAPKGFTEVWELVGRVARRLEEAQAEPVGGTQP